MGTLEVVLEWLCDDNDIAHLDEGSLEPTESMLRAL
jgi:hypothetical protein